MATQIPEREFQRVVSECDQNSKDIQELKRTTEKEFINIRTDIKTIEDKVDAIHELNKNVAVLAEGMKGFGHDIGDIKKTVETTSTKVAELEHKEADKLYANVGKVKLSVITAICTLLATGAVSALVALIASKQ